MTKGIRLLVIFLLVSIVVCSCTSKVIDDRKESEKVFREYINTLYTIKPKKSKNKNIKVEDVYPAGLFEDVMTEEAYCSLWKEQIPLVIALLANKSKSEIEVIKLDIEKFNKNKDGTMTYTYNVKLRMLSSLDKHHKHKKLRGEATLKKVNFKWKVVNDKQFNLDALLFEKGK